MQLGFFGRPGTVRRWAGQRRRDEPQATAKAPGAVAAIGQLPSGREIVRLLMAGTDVLAKTEQAFVSQLLIQAPGLADAIAIAIAKRLNGLLRRKSTESLTQVVDDAIDTRLKEFAASLRRDIGAI